MGQGCSAPLDSSSIFGHSLTHIYERGQNHLPPWLTVSLAYLMAPENLVKRETYFHTPNEKQLNALILLLESQPTLCLDDLTPYAPCTVTTFLMRFIAQLPEPLLTYQRYSSFYNALDAIHHIYGACSPEHDEYDKLHYIQALIITLPVAHFMMMKHVIHLFRLMCDIKDIDGIPQDGKAQLERQAMHTKLAIRPRTSSIVSENGKDEKEEDEKSSTLPASVSSGDMSNNISATKLAVMFADHILAPPPSADTTKAHAKQQRDPKQQAAQQQGLVTRPTPTLTKMQQAVHQNVIIYLIENWKFLFMRNPVRELSNHLPLNQDLTSETTRLTNEMRRLQHRVAHIQIRAVEKIYARRCLVKHFMAWRTTTRTHHDQTARYQYISKVNDMLAIERAKNEELRRQLTKLQDHMTLCAFDQKLMTTLGAPHALLRHDTPIASLTYQEEKEPLASVREDDIHVDMIDRRANLSRSASGDERRASVSSVTSTQSTPSKMARQDSSYRSPILHRSHSEIQQRPRFNSVGSAPPLSRSASLMSTPSYSSPKKSIISPSSDTADMERIAADLREIHALQYKDVQLVRSASRRSISSVR